MKRIFLAIWIIIALHSAFIADASVYNARDFAVEVSDDCGDDDTKDQEKGQQEYAFQIDKTLSTIFHLDFHADLNFEFEFPLILDNSPHGRCDISVENTEYFKTLFHYIISPNAP